MLRLPGRSGAYHHYVSREIGGHRHVPNRSATQVTRQAANLFDAREIRHLFGLRRAVLQQKNSRPDLGPVRDLDPRGKTPSEGPG